jgi:DNA-binding NarL/FixJ family response regulator
MAGRKPGDEKGPAKIVIVDDHPIVREGLAELINTKPDLAVCGEADNAADALSVIEKTRPDVAIVDLALKDSDGLDLIKDVRVRFPKVSILVLSMRDETFYAERVLRAGAQGYITKEEATANVIEGIRKVLSGGVYMSQNMAAKMLGRLLPGRRDTGSTPVERLTDRELQVLELVGTGLTTTEAAGRLHLSVKTIESYRERIKEKLGLDSASDLLKFAIKWAHRKQGMK